VVLRRRWCCALVLGMLALSGCSSRSAPDAPLEPTEDQLYKIGRAYTQAAVRLRRAPAKLEELRPDLPGDAESLLRSPHDGEKFVILWGVNYTTLPPGKKDPYTVAAYEQRGASGTRYVLRFPLNVVEMSEDELRAAVFPPGHQPPK
jgi:hypothetical protein